MENKVKYLLLILFAAAQYVAVKGRYDPVNLLTNCANPPVPSPMANAPELYRLLGRWYIYNTYHQPNNYETWKYDVRCGYCQVTVTGTTTYNIQCIIYDKNANQIVYVTGALTRDSGTNIITIAGTHATTTAVNAQFVVTNFNQAQCTLTVTLCSRVEFFHPYFYQNSIQHHPAEVYLAKTGNAHTPSNVQYQNCPPVTFAPKSAGLLRESFASTGTRAIPTGTNCLAAGFTLVGVAPKQRYVRLVNTLANRADANTACDALVTGGTGTLATVDTPQLFTAIQALLPALGGAAAANVAWIGLERTAATGTGATRVGTFQWASVGSNTFTMTGDPGTVAPAGTYVNFAPTLPGTWSTDADACFRVGQALTGWDGEACTTRSAYVCECNPCV